MGEAFITRRGGGTSKAFAVISVTYPSGSICTCSNETKTLTAKDTSGQWLFLLPSGGEWMVSIFDESHDTVSRTINITRQYQVERITLAYWDGTLYSNGNEYAHITGGWDGHGQLADMSITRNADHLYVLANRGGIAGINKSVDVTDYSTLIMECSMPNNYPGVTIGLIADYVDATASVYATVTAPRKQYRLDVSQITGKFFVYVASSSAFALSIFSAKLE